jgi:NAD(P) transhydrogenase
VSSKAFRLLPTGVYTIPEDGMVGDTEESPKHKGINYIVGLGPYQAEARDRIVGDDVSFLKPLFQKQDIKLLGYMPWVNGLSSWFISDSLRCSRILEC